ncbi:MAG TPA: hypothetical protein VK196_14405 [Magnetospirillum sp.]|nr:hypothetical protein [Magnetospirillum sp.]
MLFTNIRIETPSDRPSPMQSAASALTMAMDTANFCWGQFAPYRLMLMMYRLNRAVTTAMFMR